MVEIEYYEFKGMVIWISGLLFIIHLLQLFIPGFTEFFVLNGEKIYEIHRMFTSIFLHANINHLLQNIIGLIMFGIVLEAVIGWKRFLEVFILSGLVGNIAILLYDPSVIALGSSGALMGIIGALTYLRPFMPVYFYVPLPVISLSVIYILINIFGLIYPTDNIGYAAHIGGFIAGMVWGYLNKDKYKEEKPKLEDDLDLDDEEIYKIAQIKPK